MGLVFGIFPSFEFQIFKDLTQEDLERFMPLADPMATDGNRTQIPVLKEFLREFGGTVINWKSFEVGLVGACRTRV